jgi:hypothetical protein
LRHLRENVQWKRLELWCNHNWLLHHDNVPAHTSLKTTEFVTDNNVVIVPHPPYLLNLAPCDFALFPKLKMKLKGQCFETVSDIQRELHRVLNSIKENDFYRWDRCIRFKGNYFEGDDSQNWVSYASISFLTKSGKFPIAPYIVIPYYMTIWIWPSLSSAGVKNVIYFHSLYTSS